MKICTSEQSSFSIYKLELERKFCEDCRGYVKAKVIIQTAIDDLGYAVTAELKCERDHTIETYKNISVKELREMVNSLV